MLYACTTDNAELALTLLRVEDALDAAAAPSLGGPPLHVAAQSGATKVVRAILSMDPARGKSVPLSGPFAGRTIAEVSAEAGFFALAESLRTSSERIAEFISRVTESITAARLSLDNRVAQNVDFSERTLRWRRSASEAASSKSTDDCFDGLCAFLDDEAQRCPSMAVSQDGEGNAGSDAGANDAAVAPPDSLGRKTGDGLFDSLEEVNAARALLEREPLRAVVVELFIAERGQCAIESAERLLAQVFNVICVVSAID